MNGAFKTTGVPPQELVMVNVPVFGELTKVTVPDAEYVSVAGSQEEGVAVKAVIEQGVRHGAGAV